jgi:GH24 family phage-related lysozyme (muramidase)
VRTIKERGLELVKHFESLYLEAYKCPGGAWTIGWGHTGIRHNDGTVYAGRKITEGVAEELLHRDMAAFAERVESLVKVPLNNDQFDALVSFDFNTGALHKSTLLKLLNKGDYSGAAEEFPKWNKAGGKVLRGLTRRRNSEKNLFLGKDNFIIPA